MSTITTDGLQAVLLREIARVSGGSGRYGITLDLDALDPADIPGVNTPVPGGIRTDALLTALQQLSLEGLVAIEIAEYNPDRDQALCTAHFIEELLFTVGQRRHLDAGNH